MGFWLLTFSRACYSPRALAGRPARLLPRMKMSFVQFFAFKRINYPVLKYFRQLLYIERA